MIYLILAILGLCLGSFVNALVWRIKNKRDWVRERSECVHCHHELAAKDLIPVLSWLMLKGYCRYCKEPISWQYPVTEVAMAIVFVTSYIFWPVDFTSSGQWLLLATWLAVSVGLMALLVYDFRWMILPNKILYPTFFVALAGRLAYILLFASDKLTSLWHLVMVSQGKWIGYGDVRLGLATGTVLGSPSKSLLMIFLASLLGTVFVLPLIYTGKKTIVTKIPYGPFLITATWIALLFGWQIVSWYKTVTLL
jgi:prepilin signal peptidase PulO-like enzyme (type II secretory pathway)